MTAHTPMSVPGNLNDKTVTQLRALARVRGLRGYSRLRKRDLVKLLQKSPSADVPGGLKPSKRNQSRIAGETDRTVPAPRLRPPAPQPGPRAPDVDNAQAGPDPRPDTIASRPALHAPRLVALPQKPGILHVYWRLPEDPVAELRLRIVRTDCSGDRIVNEITPTTTEGNAYIRVPETTDVVEYRAELGSTRGDGSFDLLAPWAVTCTPRNAPSTDGDARWWISGEDFHNRFARAQRAGFASWTGLSSGALGNSAAASHTRDKPDPPDKSAGT